jgi:hypothetical protein
MNTTCEKPTPEMLLTKLSESGLEAQVRDQELWVRPGSRLTLDLREELRANKAAVVRLIRLAGLSIGERETWEERVAICMFDGGLSEEEAESIAWRQVEDARELRRPQEATR